jgi:hypothetical protein
MSTMAENDFSGGQVDAHLIAHYIADCIAHCIAKPAALAYVAGQAAGAT